MEKLSNQFHNSPAFQAKSSANLPNLFDDSAKQPNKQAFQPFTSGHSAHTFASKGITKV